MKPTILICVFLLSGCRTPYDEELRIKFYNDVLEEVINQYPPYCSNVDENASLLNAHNNPIKCTLDYTTQLGFFHRDHQLHDEISSIKAALKDKFIKKYFDTTSIDDIVDTLSSAAGITAAQLKNNNLEIVPYTIRGKNIYGTDIGVLGFSKIYFDKKGDKAIVYYEFVCGGKCARGEVIFVTKKLNGWKVITYERIWDS